MKTWTEIDEFTAENLTGRQRSWVTSGGSRRKPLSLQEKEDIVRFLMSQFNINSSLQYHILNKIPEANLQQFANDLYNSTDVMARAPLLLTRESNSYSPIRDEHLIAYTNRIPFLLGLRCLIIKQAMVPMDEGDRKPYEERILPGTNEEIRLTVAEYLDCYQDNFSESEPAAEDELGHAQIASSSSQPEAEPGQQAPITPLFALSTKSIPEPALPTEPEPELNPREVKKSPLKGDRSDFRVLCKECTPYDFKVVFEQLIINVLRNPPVRR